MSAAFFPASCSFRILMICSSLNRFFMLITPSAFYHIVTNFSIGSVFRAQVMSFNGTTAICSATVISGNFSDAVKVTISLWCGNSLMGSWSGSGSGMASAYGTCTAVKGNTYKLILNSTINGITQPSDYVTGVC
jgi:hypothetical protein